MGKYTSALPQMSGRPFITDGGMETFLIFQQGVELPAFSSIDLARRRDGQEIVESYSRRYIEIARKAGVGLILDTITWRASPDWAVPVGLGSTEALGKANVRGVEMLQSIQQRYGTEQSPIVISGCIGPRGDGYNPGKTMSVEDAKSYHAWQVGLLHAAGADMISALTMNYVEEAMGIAMAAREAGAPVVLSFTVETDGRLPTGQDLNEAIMEIDRATDGYPAYYMINCAHPTHFDQMLESGGPGISRIKGLRANASRCSHAELDNSTELDEGNPPELGEQLAALMARHPQINILGGCCGTDHRHIGEIATRIAA